MRFPKNRISTNDAAMIAGSRYAWWRIIGRSSSAHRAELVEVDAAPVAVQQEDDGEADTDLGGRDGDDEQREHGADGVVLHGAERDEVDVHRVQDQLDRHQHHHAVAPREDAVHADREEHRAEQQELVEQHPYSFRARTMAPTRAASNRTDTTSNGTRYCVKIVSLTAAVFEPVDCRSEGSMRSMRSSSAALSSSLCCSSLALFSRSSLVSPG